MNVIGVAGVTKNDIKGRDSGYGAYVDVSAPVEDIPTVAYDADTEEHIPWNTRGTTPSISAAQVSGVAALVWSKYPALSNAGVVRQVVATTDDISTANSQRPWSGQIGSGRVNAYRALTEWSGPLQVRSGQTLTWSGTIWVTGDVTIPSGITLALAAGTVVRFVANRDDTSGGSDATKAELIVAGTLNASAGNITFRSANNNPSALEWYGIRVRSGGSATLTNVTVRDGVRCVQAETGGSLTQTNVTLTHCGRRPGPPRAFTATAGDEQVTLSWQAPSDVGVPELSHYAYCWHPAGNTCSTWMNAGKDTSVVVGGLTNGTTYEFQVQAVNSQGASASARATATPAASNPPGNRAPTLGGPTMVTVAENSTGAVATYMASDSDGDALTWTLGGADATALSLSGTGASRDLTFNSPPDYESKSTYQVSITVNDGSLSDTLSVTITITDVDDEDPDSPGNRAPTLGGPTMVTVAENSTGAVAAYTASDLDGDALTWTLGGADATALSLSGTGANRDLTFNSPPDYESKSTYQVAITVDDGSVSVSRSVTITITNVEEEGTVSLTTTHPVVGSPVTALLTDPDGGIYGASWQWQTVVLSSGQTASETESYPELSSHTPSASDLCKGLRARVTYNDQHSLGRTAQSALTNGVVGLPSAPRNFAAQTTGLGYHTAALSWSAPSSDGCLAITYEHRHKVTSDTDWPPNWTDAGTATQASISGLQSGTSYTFEVRAENSQGPGPSASATLWTRASLPSDPDSGSVRSFTAAPNPFNPQTAVRFELPEAGPVSLVVYNLAGQPVRTLLDGGFLPAGSHVVHWDSRDEQGHLVASGVYLLRWTRQDQIIVRKITLLR